MRLALQLGDALRLAADECLFRTKRLQDRTDCFKLCTSCVFDSGIDFEQRIFNYAEINRKETVNSVMVNTFAMASSWGKLLASLAWEAPRVCQPLCSVGSSQKVLPSSRHCNWTRWRLAEIFPVKRNERSRNVFTFFYPLCQYVQKQYLYVVGSGREWLNQDLAGIIRRCTTEFAIMIDVSERRTPLGTPVKWLLRSQWQHSMCNRIYSLQIRVSQSYFAGNFTSPDQHRGKMRRGLVSTA